MINWIKRLIFERKLNHAYRTNRLDIQARVNEKHFPLKSFMLFRGLYAYDLEFLISEEDVLRVKKVISENFPLKTEELYFKAELSNSDNLQIHIHVHHNFNGAVVLLVTNSVSLLNSLDNLKLQTLPPWIVFPNADPDYFTCTQGNEEYWSHCYFVPFWCSLNIIEKFSYIENAPPKWRELFFYFYMYEFHFKKPFITMQEFADNSGISFEEVKIQVDAGLFPSTVVDGEIMIKSH